MTSPCGRDPDWLVEIAAADPDAPLSRDAAEHLRTCRYCADRLAELRERLDRVRATVAPPVRTPPDLVGRSVAAVRAIRGGGVGSPVLVAQRGGSLRISEQVVALLTRQVATELLDPVAGVRLQGIVGDGEGLALRLAVGYGLSLPDVGRWVQRAVGAALESTLGVAVPAVRVEIVDLLVPSTAR